MRLQVANALAVVPAWATGCLRYPATPAVVSPTGVAGTVSRGTEPRHARVSVGLAVRAFRVIATAPAVVSPTGAVGFPFGGSDARSALARDAAAPGAAVPIPVGPRAWAGGVCPRLVASLNLPWLARARNEPARRPGAFCGVVA